MKRKPYLGSVNSSVKVPFTWYNPGNKIMFVNIPGYPYDSYTWTSVHRTKSDLDMLSSMNSSYIFQIFHLC